jgi:hypothetical protein
MPIDPVVLEELTHIQDEEEPCQHAPALWGVVDIDRRNISSSGLIGE